MKVIATFLGLFVSLQTFAGPDLPLPLPDEPPGENQPVPPENPPPKPAPPTKPPPVQEVTYTLGTGGTERFGEQVFYFNPRYDLSYLKSIRIVGSRAKIRVESVTAYFSDIGEREITSLRGDISAGSSRVANLQGRPVLRITVIASSPYFWKKPGGFRLDAVALQRRGNFDSPE